MCVNYQPPKREQLDYFNVPSKDLAHWPSETWQDYAAPIILAAPDGGRNALLATYGMIPKKRISAGAKKYTTMNARHETVASLRSYSKAWKTGQRCLVPMQCFYEPHWETGKHVRWRIGMHDGSPFAVAGLWRAWAEEDGGYSYSFTQLTNNADNHAVMKHFHRPGDEKRMLVIIRPADYDPWLTCKDPEMARTFMGLYPAELMTSAPAPREGKG